MFDQSATAAEKRRLVFIFTNALAVGVVIAVVAVREVGTMTRTSEQILAEHAESAIAVERLNTLSEKMGRVYRSYLLTGDPRFLAELRDTRQAFTGTAALLRSRLDNEHVRRMLDQVRRLEARRRELVDEALAKRELRDVEELVKQLERDVAATLEQQEVTLAALSDSERRDFERARNDAEARSRGSVRFLLVVAAISVVLAAALAWLLSRTLSGLARSRAALDASLAKLERANRDLDAFAGRIAHDLRNILAPVPLNAERLRRKSDSRETVESIADKFERIGRRADGMIEALLAFARAGQPSDITAAASVRRAVAEALDDVADLRALVDAEVTVEVEDIDVRCADSLLYTVLANLLTNALKFLEGRPERRVRICARQSGTLCELTVEDTGPGIPADAQPRIFEPFFRAPDAKVHGTGIGLATVQRVVDAHGGRVTVRSSPERGTTFMVRLPLAWSRRRSEGVAVPAQDPVIH